VPFSVSGAASPACGPDPARPWNSLTGPLELLEAATTQDLLIPDQIRTLIDRLETELEAPGGSGLAGRLVRLVAVLGTAPEGQALEKLLTAWLQAGGASPSGVLLLPFSELTAGLQGAAEALGT